MSRYNHQVFSNVLILLQALNDDDDAGGDDLAVNVDGGKMDEFFQEVEEIR